MFILLKTEKKNIMPYIRAFRSYNNQAQLNYINFLLVCALVYESKRQELKQ